ncbi:MAG: hypothetical protein SV375_14875, partial [Thermodesulfobacteriota bacterium]|nr:hypothetical protein [Thermodesulfobacteriota bacterium]
LANPAAIKQYEGLKHTDDKWDSFWLAHMKRLEILPEGYIYFKEERPVRDALRRWVTGADQIKLTAKLQYRNIGCGHGWEPRPSWVAVVVNGKKAIFFNGEVFLLLTNPLMGDP